MRHGENWTLVTGAEIRIQFLNPEPSSGILNSQFKHKSNMSFSKTLYLFPDSAPIDSVYLNPGHQTQLIFTSSPQPCLLATQVLNHWVLLKTVHHLFFSCQASRRPTIPWKHHPLSVEINDHVYLIFFNALLPVCSSPALHWLLLHFTTISFSSTFSSSDSQELLRCPVHMPFSCVLFLMPSPQTYAESLPQTLLCHRTGLDLNGKAHRNVHHSSL